MRFWETSRRRGEQEIGFQTRLAELHCTSDWHVSYLERSESSTGLPRFCVPVQWQGYFRHSLPSVMCRLVRYCRFGLHLVPISSIVKWPNCNYIHAALSSSGGSRYARPRRCTRACYLDGRPYPVSIKSAQLGRERYRHKSTWRVSLLRSGTQPYTNLRRYCIRSFQSRAQSMERVTTPWSRNKRHVTTIEWHLLNVVIIPFPSESRDKSWIKRRVVGFCSEFHWFARLSSSLELSIFGYTKHTASWHGLWKKSPRRVKHSSICCIAQRKSNGKYTAFAEE